VLVIAAPVETREVVETGGILMVKLLGETLLTPGAPAVEVIAIDAGGTFRVKLFPEAVLVKIPDGVTLDV
jgi:hypothetical protein